MQNGKLVGAVTHVFVNEPTRGYGILAEWMAIRGRNFADEFRNEAGITSHSLNM